MAGMTQDRPAARRSNGTDGAKRLAVRRLVPIAVVVAGLAAFYAFGLDAYVSFDALRTHRALLVDWVDRYGVGAGLGYAVVYAVAVGFSLPGAALLTIVGGFLFGPYWATVWAVIGATAGATALFLAARYAFADYLRAKAGPALRRMDDGLRDNALYYLLFLRLVPAFPFWLVNLVPALLGVRLRVYVIGTFLGIIPGAFVFALVGDGIGAVLDAGQAIDVNTLLDRRLLAPIAGLAGLALIPVLWRWFKAPKRQ